jgi:DNA-binding MarR family transcriptional regulator
MPAATSGDRAASPSAPQLSPSAAPRGCTNFKLRQLTRRVTQHFDQIVAAAGIRTTQYSLLSHIEQLGPVSPGALARAMAMDPSTLTRNLRPLLDQGWAGLGPGADGRARLVTATPAGRAKRAEAGRQWKRAQLALNERLGAVKVAQLHDLLDECRALMDPASPEEPT